MKTTTTNTEASTKIQISFLYDYIQTLEAKVTALETDKTYSAKAARDAKNRRFHTLEKIETAKEELNTLIS